MTLSRNAPILLLVMAFLFTGCGAGTVKLVPISLKYVPSKKALMKVASGLGSVAIGTFVDSRSGRPAAAVGERVHFNRDIDRFQPKSGVTDSITDIVRDYFLKRKVRTLRASWDGELQSLRSQPGDIVISGRIMELWFTSTDSATMGSASSVFRVVLKVGSAKTGTIITKTIQIKPVAQRNIFWESKEVEKWLSHTISEALDRILPSIEIRLIESQLTG